MSYEGERELGKRRQKGAGQGMGTKSDYEREGNWEQTPGEENQSQTVLTDE